MAEEQKRMIKVLFGLRLYVPVNNFSVMSGRSHRFLGITSTFWAVRRNTGTHRKHRNTLIVITNSNHQKTLWIGFVEIPEHTGTH